MGKSKPFQRLKDFIRHVSRNGDKQDAHDNRSTPTPTPGQTPAPHPITPPTHTTLPVSENVPTLWNRAYEALRVKDAPLVTEYEILLSKELDDHKSNTNARQDMPQQNDRQDRHDNQIDTDPDKRYAQLTTITDRGLRRADDKQTKYTTFGHQFVLRDQVKEAALFVQALKGLVNEAVKASPEASLVWAGMCVLLPVFTNPSAAEEANRSGLLYVASRLRYYVEVERLLWPKSLIEPGLKTEFDSHIVDLYQDILEFQVKTVLRFYRKWLANLGRDVFQHDEWDGLVAKIKEREQIVQKESNTLNNFASRYNLETISKAAQRQYNNMQSLLSVAKDHLAASMQNRDISAEQLAELKLQTQILEDRPIDLPIVYEARYDSADVQDSPRCESGTRTRIQQTIYQWADDESGEPIFWLLGPAGTGKSTVARTVADSLAREKRLVAGYFFKRGEQGRNSTTRLFPTLAAQLAEAIPPFKGCLWKFLGGVGRDAVDKKGLEAQFDQLFWQPLAELSVFDTGQLIRVIIIDALDECEQPAHLSRVLSELSRLGALATVRLRVLITSRPEVASAFQTLPKTNFRTLKLLDRELREDSRTDIELYVRKRFADVSANRKFRLDSWPAPEDFKRLLHLSTTPEPLFIYAATLCRFVCSERVGKNPKRQLRLWLKQCDENHSQLNQMYEPVLRQLCLDSDEAETTQLLQLLGSIVLVAEPLSASSLACLLSMDTDDITCWLQGLHAVLDVPNENRGPIRLLHKSFSDFLLSPVESGASDHRVNTVETHAMLAIKCIQRMIDGLQRDICDTQQPDVLRDDIDEEVIDTHVPPGLRYACLYWVYHLQKCGEPLGDEVYVFLKMHLLHWLEVLALLGKVLVGAAAIDQLSNMCQQRSKEPTELSEFVKDASKVIGSFGSMIERTPLQVYGALILFSPVSSRVRQRCWDQRLLNVPCIHGVKSDWDALRQTLEGHASSVSAVAFSPDGQVVASASDDKTVRLWDAATGTLRQTLEGHTSSVNAVAFSPDGQVVASASDDRTVRLWDAATGTLRQTLEGHTSSVEAVAFSPDSQVVVLASRDDTVRLWDAATGALRQTLEGHTDWVNAVAFSPDGQAVASASRDRTVRLWDAATGTLRQTLKGHTSSVNAVAFSPDSQVVASASDDRTVRLWDAATGTLRQTLKGHTSWVEAAMGGRWQMLEGHTSSVEAVAFSPDGQAVASASDDETVRLWDAATGTLRQTLEGHTSYVNAVAFSPDSQVVASASRDDTVRLWDAATGALRQTLEGHTSSVNAVAFSPDGQVVASASYDRTVRLWDAATGAPRQTLEGFTQNLAFDPCSRNRLLTNFGAVDVVTVFLGAKPYPRGETPSSSAGRGLGISPDRTWIMEGGKKNIWLPIEYRSTASAIRGSIMFIGCASGRVMHISATSQYP